MYVNNLSKDALDSAAAGIEPAISSRKSNGLTTTPPSHTKLVNFIAFCQINYYYYSGLLIYFDLVNFGVSFSWLHAV